MRIEKIVILPLLLCICVLARLLPHPANFAPVAAAALFAAAHYRSLSLRLALPLGAMFLSDAVIGFYNWKLMAAVYCGLTLPPIIAGAFLAKFKPGAIGVVAGALFSSVGFFLISNTAVWAISPFYAHSLQGLAACLTAAIPFFKNTVLGDLCWSATFFGGYALWQAAQTAFEVRRFSQLVPVKAR
jgi:hypothetical protein